jgi:hypothetical protein
VVDLMGYVPQRTTYKLIFPAEYNGLEVVTYAGSVAQYLDIAKLADVDLSAPIGADMLELVFPLFEAFDTVLVRWNIEQPKGKKVPGNAAGLKSLELPLAMAIINAWMNAVAGSIPLDGTDLDLPVEPLGT